MNSSTDQNVTKTTHQRLRLTILGLLYVYMAGHIFFWYVLDIKPWGKTAMVGVPSLLAGHINAAAVMVFAILVSIFFYGRGFCGWACHMRGAIEFADWGLMKLGIKNYSKLRDKNILLNTRYRWLLRLGAIYILLIPVIVYWKEKGFSLSVDFMSPPPLSDLPNLDNESLWDHFPLNLFSMEYSLALYLFVAGFAVVLVIFVMSFVLNYFYGQGAFCRILCPYAVLFVPFMNLSPWQKKITRIKDCTGCRKCSNTCPQGIDVSREIYHYGGKVINRECIKCYNCIDICDNSTLRDINTPAAPQLIPRKEYDKKPWLSTEKHLQNFEPINPILDFISIIFALIAGALASELGGFYFFVGAIAGYILFRKAVIYFGSGSEKGLSKADNSQS